jgi:hypothetical protein
MTTLASAAAFAAAAFSAALFSAAALASASAFALASAAAFSSAAAFQMRQASHEVYHSSVYMHIQKSSAVLCRARIMSSLHMVEHASSKLYIRTKYACA